MADLRPLLGLGSDLLPAGAELPRLARLKVSWTASRLGGWWEQQGERRSWGLPLTRGLLVPAGLLEIPTGITSPAQLEIGGRQTGLPLRTPWKNDHLALLDLSPASPPWPSERVRRPAGPEDTIVLGGPGQSALPLDAGRLAALGEKWHIDPRVTLPADRHGAPVLARADGAVVGLLILGDSEEAVVALVPERWP